MKAMLKRKERVAIRSRCPRPSCAKEGRQFLEDTVGGVGRAVGATSARHLLLTLRSNEQRTGEIWETVSYLAIWLCGLIGIGLCFL